MFGDAGQIVWAVGTNLLAQCPLLLVWLAGVVFAITNRRKHPNKSRLTVAAIAIFLLLVLANSIIGYMGPLIMRDQGWSPQQLGIFYVILGLISSLIAAVAWLLILLALFRTRDNENVGPLPAPYRAPAGLEMPETRRE